MNYVGIDYHKKYSVVTAIDQEGHVICDQEPYAKAIVAGSLFNNRIASFRYLRHVQYFF